MPVDLRSVTGVLIGRLEGADEQGRPLVTWEGESAPRPARVVWMNPEPQWAQCGGISVVLGFESPRPLDPILLALMEAPLARPLRSESALVPENLHIQSSGELTLRCGKACISLREDGRVTIRGGYILSRSTGLNKIKGASTQIN